MIKLTKGNEANLEGKVMIYSKLTDSFLNDRLKKPSILVSSYFTTYIEDFIEKSKAPREVMDCTEKHIKEMKESAKKELGKEPRILPVYSFFPVFYSEDELKQSKSDIIYTGSFANPMTNMESIDLGAKIYFIKFEEQVAKNLNLNNILNNLKKTDANLFNYSNFKGKKIKEHIRDRYIVPMIDAKGFGNVCEFDKLRLNFIGFIAGSNYTREALDLCTLIDKASKTTLGLELIENYMNKIEAIHSENYESAKKLQDKIDFLAKDLRK